ncbi:MAG TPA: MBL fold metallo-hydrolase [Thermoanaerobaculia bacterium]|jgi:L-ascorbate metabolism protein UlaG (beta-lactamase superfamily)
MAHRVRYTLIGGIGMLFGGGALAGWLLSAPKYRGPKSDHFDGEKFRNLEPTQHAGIPEMAKWLSNRDEGPWEKWREITPGPPPPERVAGLRVTLINHATLLVQTENVNILTDPIWSERCSPVQFAGPRRHHAPGLRFEDLPPIDVVILSHNHYDHMDVPTLRRLAREHHPRIFAGLGNGAFLKSKGIGNVTELDWFGSAELREGMSIHAVPAQHFSSRGLNDRDANLWCGYVIETSRGPVYFAGDTGWGSHFENIRERYGPPRLALLPIGAFRPEWFMCAVHISPKDAVRAAQALQAELSIPMHYGTFHLGDDGQDEPPAVLRRELANAPGVQFEILGPGESLER